VRHAKQSFEGAAGSVSAARRFVSVTLEAEGADDAAWTAVQIVSELATNAVVHAATSFTVTVIVDYGLVRVAVTDSKPLVAATQRHFSDYTTTGRGLRLVERMSRAWGVDTTQDSKTVWCEIVRAASGGGLDIATDSEVRTATSDDETALPKPAPPSDDQSVTKAQARAIAA
jgi:anti-sigma regulatory factor (Ser/Thr protein kinase)